MRSILSLLIASTALVAATPASALLFIGDNSTPGTGFSGSFVPGGLQVDYILPLNGSVALTFEVEANDFASQTLDAFFDLIAPLGTDRVLLSLTGGPTFVPGTASAAFSNVAIVGSGANYALGFKGLEFVSASIGDIGLGGTDWTILLTGLTAGSRFDLIVNAVPAPAALALFGLGLGALALRRRAA